MMRRVLIFLAMTSAAALAQTHVVKKPETVVRAVAVYEWTGPEAKPVASRLVPVSIFIDAQLQDAGLYMARPVPFALDRGTVFEMQKAGVPEGTIDLALQRHLQAADATPFDEGWLGFGVFKPVAKEPVTALKQKGPLPEVVASGGTRPRFGTKPDASSSSTTPSSNDPDRPTMKRRTDSSDAGTTSAADDSAKPSTPSPTDSNRPVLQKRGDSSGTASVSDSTAADSTAADSSSGSATTDDAHRPVMRRRGDTPDSGTANSGSGNSTTADSSDDVDRPTLKKRTPAQSKSAQKKGDQASVTSTGSLNDDPDRPTLHRGGAAGLELPPLNGLPADMQQMVAVSDAKDRPLHDFTRAFESDDERTEVQAKLRDAARARLAKYDVSALAPAASPAAAPAAAPVKSRPGVRPKKPVVAPAPAPAALADEKLNGYTLSYGGAATFVYTASSPGVGGATRYVSIVAQREPLGELKVALSSVTDSTHLDRAPWMRLVDVVDAEASNRASLLFEMRAQHSRQFALYRVIGAEAQQVFETGTTE